MVGRVQSDQETLEGFVVEDICLLRRSEVVCFQRDRLRCVDRSDSSVLGSRRTRLTPPAVPSSLFFAILSRRHPRHQPGDLPGDGGASLPLSYLPSSHLPRVSVCVSSLVLRVCVRICAWDGPWLRGSGGVGTRDAPRCRPYPSGAPTPTGRPGGVLPDRRGRLPGGRRRGWSPRPPSHGRKDSF